MNILKAVIEYFDLNKRAMKGREGQINKYSDKELFDELCRRGYCIEMRYDLKEVRLER